MIYDNFIPGHWLDTVDVNDFVNLNKKPFLSSPIFLKNKKFSSNDSLYAAYQLRIKTPKSTFDLSFSSMNEAHPDGLHPSFASDTQTKIGLGENLKDVQSNYGIPVTSKHRLHSPKTIYETFDDLATTDLKKLNKLKVFDFNGASFSPSFLFPDFRIIPLYGTKFLIKDKKLKIKLMDDQFQSADWIETRTLLVKEIESLKALEKFSKKHKIPVTEPVSSAKELLDCLYVCILAIYAENPSIPFSLSELLPFIDIYFDEEIESGKHSEEEITEWFDAFLFRLATLDFSYSHRLPFYFSGKLFYLGETINAKNLTKTTYRFLQFIQKYEVYSFGIRVILPRKIPAAFGEYLYEMVSKQMPLLVIDEESFPNQPNLSYHPFSLLVENSETVSFDGGVCDLLKVFFLSINGGKDVESPVTIFPYTQPIQSAHIPFEQALLNFKKLMMYIASSHVQMTNLLSYLSHTRTTYPLRHAFYSRQKAYSYFFKFSNLQKVSYFLTAMYFENCLAEFNEKGLISQFSIIQSMDEDAAFMDKQKEVFHHLKRSITMEFERLILYKNGQHFLQFSPHGFFEEQTISDHASFIGTPFESPKSILTANVSYAPDSFENALHFQECLFSMFDNGYTQISLSGKSEWKSFMGAVIKKY